MNPEDFADLLEEYNALRSERDEWIKYHDALDAKLDREKLAKVLFEQMNPGILWEIAVQKPWIDQAQAIIAYLKED